MMSYESYMKLIITKETVLFTGMQRKFYIVLNLWVWDTTNTLVRTSFVRTRFIIPLLFSRQEPLPGQPLSWQGSSSSYTRCIIVKTKTMSFPDKGSLSWQRISCPNKDKDFFSWHTFLVMTKTYDGITGSLKKDDASCPNKHFLSHQSFWSQ